MSVTGITGALKHLRIDKESTWGEWVGSGLLYIPVLGDGYTVKGKADPYDPETGIFGYNRGPFGRLRKDISGDLTCLLQVGYLEKLFDWGIKRSAAYEAESYSAEFRDGVQGFRHTGLRANTFTFAGDAENGDLSVAFALVGKDESQISQFDIPTVTADVATGYVDADFFQFQDGDLLEVPDGTALGTVQAFSIEVANNLTVGPAGSDDMIIHASANRQVITGSVTLLYENDTEAAKLRAFTASSLDLNFNDGTTDLQVTLPKLIWTDIPRDGAQSETLIETLNFEAEYSSGDGYAMTYTIS